MRRSYRKQTRRKTNRRNRKKSKTRSKSSGYKPSVHNSIPGCVKLFIKYKLTSVAKLVKWMKRNHADQANARGSKQSPQLQGDYQNITGCFANRKQILKHVQSSKTKSKSHQSLNQSLNLRRR